MPADTDQPVCRLLHLLWRMEGRRHRFGPRARCARCGEHRVLALSWVRGQIVCARCWTGRAVEWHHVHGRDRDPWLVAPVPTNWHRIISALTPAGAAPACPRTFLAVARCGG